MVDQEKIQENLGPTLDINGRISVFPSSPLPELNAAGGAAYDACFKNEAAQGLFAVICTREHLPRIEDVNSMRSIDSAGVVRFREAGVLFWPEQNAHFYTLFFEKPRAGRFWENLSGKHPLMTEDAVMQTFIQPLARALVDFMQMGMVHGGIRPTNIFWQHGSSTPPQLGESMSAPCGVGQPAIFETIERSMCPDVARGVGQHADDCYAFGATLAMVLLGRNPFEGIDDRAILNAKLEHGSFNAFIGDKRIPSTQIELLRGLLSDDPLQRWTAEDVQQWASGRRQTARSSDAGRKASRQFKLGNREFWRIKPLAMALAEDVREAVRVIEDGSLIKWITRSLGDGEIAKDIKEAIERLRGATKATHYQDQLVARVCIAMDPNAPIRYRGVHVAPSGIGSYLAYLMRTKAGLQVVGEIISSQLVTFWVNMQRETKVDLVPLAQMMERMSSVMSKSSLGEGIERVLYELNPSMPCLSEQFNNQFVIAPRHVLSGLERAASSGARSAEPIDRHIAGFLIAREKRSTSLFLAMDPAQSRMRRGLAMLNLLGELQYRHGPDSVPNVAGWIMPMVEPCFSRFLSKPLQDKVRTQAQEAVRAGNLSKLLKVLDDPKRVVGDVQGFEQARQMYKNIQAEIGAIEREMKDKRIIIRDVGRPVAASTASFIALVLIGIVMMRAMWSLMG